MNRGAHDASARRGLTRPRAKARADHGWLTRAGCALLLTTATSLVGMLSGGHSAPAGVVARATGTPPHIMVIVDENKGYSAAQGTPFIIGNTADAPYINNTLATTYTSATNWFSNVHGSVADYEGMLSGAPLGGAGPTLVDELASAGISWKAYMEDMPTTCYRGSPVGNYDPNHNPFIDYTSITATSQCNNVVPYTNAVSDLNSPSPPSFVWISPNVCNDMHTNGSAPPASCPSNPVATGDTWLANNIPAIMSSAWYGQNGIIIVTWDESNGGDNVGFNGGTGGHIATLVISSNTRQTYSGGGNLFGILRGIESTYGVNYLGASADPANGDISAAFGQVPTTGSIDGSVKDSSTNEAIANATVSYSGGSTTTDSNGKYALALVAPGTYTVTAATTGYVSDNHDVTVAAGVRATQDFALMAVPPPPPPPPPFAPHNVGAPQVAVTPDGSTQLVFWRDTTTNQLAEAWYTGVWNGPVEFPQLGTLSSAPGVAVTKDGSTQLVFWRGPSGDLMEAWYTGTWNGPLDITTTYLLGHAALGSAPSVTTTKDGTQLVFWRGTDGHLGEAWYSNGWHSPGCAGCPVTTLGSMASAPSSTVTADGSTQLVFFQGTNNLLTEDWFTGVWNGPMTLGSLTSPPSVAVTPDGSTQLVFYKSAAGHLVESWYTGRWNGPVDFTTTAFAGNGPLTSAPAAAVTPDGSTQLVFWQGAGSTLWEGWYAGGAWHGPVNWSG